MSSYLPPGGYGWPPGQYGGPQPAYYPYPGPPGSGAVPAQWPRIWAPPSPAAPSPDWARWWNLWLAKICVVASAFGAIFCFFDCAVILALLTDPLFTQRDLAEASSLGVSFLLLGVYFFIAAVSGLVLAVFTSKKVRAGYRAGAALMMVFPGLLMFLLSVLIFVVPVVRGILASLPVMGAGLLAWAAGTSPYSGNDPSETGIFRWGAGLQMGVPLAMAVIFEAVYSSAKVAGIIIIYPSFVFLAVLAMAQGCTAYILARRRWGSVLGRPAGAGGWPQVTAPSAREATLPHEGTGHRPALGPAALAVLAVVFLAALYPAAYALTTPPQLDIIKAEGRYTQGNAHYDIQVVNRGGQAALGSIEVWLENTTFRVMVATLDRFDGYGDREFSGDYRDSSITTHTQFDVVLYYNDAEQDRMTLRQPPECVIMSMLLPVALAGGALPALTRRLRMRPRE